ncbi:MAG TPA: LPS export ABC transporter periplasmic protein LptC [Bacteroidia bacterium]|nr:LPS export ABC transporter periplasmic protein LptC [Bacteroidia bacterium]
MLVVKNILFLLILATTFFFASCENDLNEVALLTKKGKLAPTESSTDLNVLSTDSGKLVFRLKAPLMDHYVIGVEDPYSEFPKGIYIENYDKNNKVKTTMKADYAIRYEKTKKMEAKQHIVIVNENGETLTTEHLIWNEETKRIKSDTYVEIKTKKEIIKGTGMEANEDFTEWEILNVTGTIPLPDEEK